MFEALFVAALLNVTDPAGDAGRNLTPPTAAAFRQEGAFDLRNVTVYRTQTLTFSVTLGNQARFPGAILELYFGNSPDEAPGTGALLPGSALRLPAGASWRYAFRVVGNRVQVFRGQGGVATDVTEASGARLSTSGTTLTVATRLPVPAPLSVYGIAGSYDPFSSSGWRTLRAEPSPWGFAGTAASPVLDVLADTPEVQARALEQGVLPEVRASVSKLGWLALAGVGALLAFAGLGVSLGLGRRVNLQAKAPPVSYLTPFTEADRRRRARVLRDLSRVEGQLTLAEQPPLLEPTAAPAEPVLN